MERLDMKELYKEISELSCDIMNTSYILLDYCKRQADSEDITGIRPIVSLLYDMADTLCLKIGEGEERF